MDQELDGICEGNLEDPYWQRSSIPSNTIGETYVCTKVPREAHHCPSPTGKSHKAHLLLTLVASQLQLPLPQGSEGCCPRETSWAEEERQEVA